MIRKALEGSINILTTESWTVMTSHLGGAFLPEAAALLSAPPSEAESFSWALSSNSLSQSLSVKLSKVQSKTV